MQKMRRLGARGIAASALSTLVICGCSHTATLAASSGTSSSPPAFASPSSPWPGISLPFAEHAREMDSAPVIVVDARIVTLDGETVGDVRSIAASGRMQRLDDLFTALKRKREAWRAAHPGQPFGGQ